MVRLVLVRLLALVTLIAAASAQASAEGFVTLADGRKIFLDCTGQGSPTVIFEGGFGAPSTAWFKVQPVIAKVTETCSYDRAGYGKSDPGPMPRDGLAVARDLSEVLDRAHVRGPFVLVGHSAGALYARIFADLRPTAVVGMVLVDPSIEYQDQRFEAAFGPNAGSIAPLRARAQRCLDTLNGSPPALTDLPSKPCPPTLTADSYRTQISELDSLWTSTSDEIARGRQSYGSMPLIVLTADKTYGTGAGAVVVEAFWSKLHQEIAHRSSVGREQAVSNSSHMMMFDRPDAIEQSILEVIATVRARH